MHFAVSYGFSFEGAMRELSRAGFNAKSDRVVVVVPESRDQSSSEESELMKLDSFVRQYLLESGIEALPVPRGDPPVAITSLTARFSKFEGSIYAPLIGDRVLDAYLVVSLILSGAPFRISVSGIHIDSGATAFYSLSDFELTVLDSVINSVGGARISRIAEATGLNPGTVFRIISRLENRRLVRREGRSIVPTELGIFLHAKARSTTRALKLK